MDMYFKDERIPYLAQQHAFLKTTEESKEVCSLDPIAKFHLGRLITTPQALECLDPEDILRGIQRQLAGDWGDLSNDDFSANDQALVEGRRVLAPYIASNGTKFWIITEADRSVTKVLLPTDY